MIEENGQVIAVQGDGVLVETIRQSACTSCSAAKGCGQKMLASIGQGQRFQVLAANPQNLILQTGDNVVLGLEESALLRASLLAYMLPLLLMMVFAALAHFSGQTEPLIAMSGVVGLAAGLFSLRWLSRADDIENCRYHPQILRSSQSV